MRTGPSRLPRLMQLAGWALLALALPAAAQWSPDPAVNLSIADRVSEQVVPKVAPRADGGCYVGWFDLASGSYDVYLQRLDAGGVEQWPHNGILVSDHPQNSWLVDWDLITDSAGNAVLAFADARTGDDFDIQAYKIGPGGEMLWGADGISLSSNNDLEPAPRIAEAVGGDLVFVWARMPDAGNGSIMMQRITPAGTPLFPFGGLSIVSAAGESPGFCSIVPAEAGNAIVSWVRDVSAYMSPRHLRACKFSPAGSSVWPTYVNVFDATVLPIAHDPTLLPDGAGGAILGWHRSQGNMFNAFVQHLNASGTELFGDNGVMVSTVGARHHIDPAVAYWPATGEIFVFWNERNPDQTLWGIFGQKFSAAGLRQWTDAGLQWLPVDGVFKYGPRCLPWAGGVMVFLIEEPGGYGQDHIIGQCFDTAGAKLWGDSPVVISSLLSGKARLPVDIDPAGVAKLIWEDDRAGSVDVYGQNVNPDGSLGASTGVPDDAAQAAGALLRGSYPNPFNPKTTIRYELPAAAGVSVAIHEPSGRCVRVLLDSEWQAEGTHEIVWDGCDGAGRPLSSGLFLAQLTSGGRSESLRLVLLK